MSTTAFAPSPAQRYGGSLLPGSQASVGQDSQLPTVAGPSAEDHTLAVHPDHPMFWLALILAGAVGLAYLSTTVRVGPVAASASVGKK